MEYSRVASDVKTGRNVIIHGFVNLYGCRIGDNTSIGAFVEIQKGAVIGKNCKISSHSFICEGVMIEDNVFIGHNVTFINDLFPLATNPDGTKKTDTDWTAIPTLIGKGASIGSSVTILCGVTIGAGAIVGAGSMIVRDVPSGEIWAGNPAKYLRKVVET
jgi:UDP-2-acetamido-3-amino-2,3-dideoxy-glucuronate N-acetyltransferase